MNLRAKRVRQEDSILTLRKKGLRILRQADRILEQRYYTTAARGALRDEIRTFQEDIDRMQRKGSYKARRVA